MEELSGRNIQVVLSIKEGLGFGFLTNPVSVSVSLNGYTLETDAVMPSHTPIFDSELVWEADKKQFRNLRLQNVPMKVEVFSTNARSRREKIGYLLLSLLSAQPCPTNKNISVNRIWHKLLGVKAEGKCCHPQLLMSLAVEDRLHNPTPRNELTVFHCNETTQPSVHSTLDLTPVPLKEVNSAEIRAETFTLGDYYAEIQKKIPLPDLVPQLNSKEGLINIGNDKKTFEDIFLLSFTIGNAENVDMFKDGADRQAGDIDTEDKTQSEYCISYTMFAQTIQTDRFPANSTNGTHLSVKFNQKTSMRLKTNLSTLSRYFAECPYVVIKLCNGSKDIGICNMDLRKLVPTDNLKDFLSKFATNKVMSDGERRFLMSCQTASIPNDDGRKPYVDIEVALKYIPTKEKFVNKEVSLTSRSAGPAVGEGDGCISSGIEGSASRSIVQREDLHVYKTDIENRDRKLKRCQNEREEHFLNHPDNDIAEIIKKVILSLSNDKDIINKNADYRKSLEKVAPSRDVSVQCENSRVATSEKVMDNIAVKCTSVCLSHCLSDPGIQSENYRSQGQNTCQSECHLKEKLKCSIPPEERKELLRKMLEELEEWKYRQEEIFNAQLKQKEEEYLDVLSNEWTSRRTDVESQLSRGIEQCRTLAAQLNQATEEFQLKGYQNNEREQKLLQAKEALEKHYNIKYEGLREASRKLEREYEQSLRSIEGRCSELQGTVALLEKDNQLLQERIRNKDIELEIVKNSGLTKEQTATLIHELRSTEEKLDNALQSKTFFKEQWGRAVRELHKVKLHNRKYNLLTHHNDQEHGLGFEDMILDGKSMLEADQHDMDKLKDNICEEASDTETDKSSMMDTERRIGTDVSSFIDKLGTFDSDRSKPYRKIVDDRVKKLKVERDKLLLDDNLDDDKLVKLNRDIRNIIIDEKS